MVEKQENEIMRLLKWYWRQANDGAKILLKVLAFYSFLFLIAILLGGVFGLFYGFDNSATNTENSVSESSSRVTVENTKVMYESLMWWNDCAKSYDCWRTNKENMQNWTVNNADILKELNLTIDLNPYQFS